MQRSLALIDRQDDRVNSSGSAMEGGRRGVSPECRAEQHSGHQIKDVQDRKAYEGMALSAERYYRQYLKRRKQTSGSVFLSDHFADANSLVS